MAAINRGRPIAPLQRERNIDGIDFFMISEVIMDIRKEVNQWLLNLRGHDLSTLQMYLNRGSHMYKYIIQTTAPKEWAHTFESHINYLRSLNKFIDTHQYFSNDYVYYELKNGIGFMTKAIDQLQKHAWKCSLV